MGHIVNGFEAADVVSSRMRYIHTTQSEAGQNLVASSIPVYWDRIQVLMGVTFQSTRVVATSFAHIETD